MAITVGLKPKKNKNTSLSITPSSNKVITPSSMTPNIVQNPNQLNQVERDQQKLAVMKEQSRYMDSQKAYQNAQSHDEKMMSRNWIQKLFNIDPDAGFFSNVLNAITSPLQKFDDIAFSTLDAITGDVAGAKKVWTDDWNHNRPEQVADFFAHSVGRMTGQNIDSFDQWVENSTASKGGKTALKVLGFVGDLLGDPANLALAAVAPFTGGASEAVAISRTAAREAQVAIQAGHGEQVVKSMELLRDNDKFGEVFNDLKNGREIPAQYAKNPMVKSMKEFGDANGYTKKTKHAMQMSWETTAGFMKDEKGANQAFDLEKYTNSIDKFANGRAKVVDALHRFKNVTEWALNPAFKGAGVALKGAGKGLEKLAQTDTAIGKGARNLQAVGQTTKAALAKKFNRNQGLSGKSVTAYEQQRGAVHNLKEKIEPKLGAVSSGLDHTSDEASKLVRGVETQKGLDKTLLNPADKNSPTVQKAIDELSKNRQFKKHIKEHADFIHKLESDDPKSLKQEILDNVDNKDKTENSVYHQRLKHAVENINSIHREANKSLIKDTMSKSQRPLSKATTIKKLKEQKKLAKTFNFDTSTTQIDREREFLRAEKFIKAQDPEALSGHKQYISDLLDDLAKNPKAYDKLSSSDIDLLTAVLKPFARKLEAISTSRLSSGISEHLNKVTRGGETIASRTADSIDKKSAFHEYAKIANDKSEFLNNLKRSFYPAYDNSSDPKKLKANTLTKLSERLDKKPEAQEAFKEYLHSNVARSWLSQHLSPLLNATQGTKTFEKNMSTMLRQLSERGELELADSSKTPMGNAKVLQEAVKARIGKDVSEKQAQDYYKNLLDFADDFEKKKLKAINTRLQMTGQTVENKSRKEIEADFDKHISVADKAKLSKLSKIQAELEQVNRIGDRNTQRLVSDLDKGVFAPHRKELLDKYHKEVEEKSTAEFEKTTKQAIYKHDTAVKKLQARLDDLKNDTTRQQATDALNSSKQRLAEHRKNFKDTAVKNKYVSDIMDEKNERLVKIGTKKFNAHYKTLTNRAEQRVISVEKKLKSLKTDRLKPKWKAELEKAKAELKEVKTTRDSKVALKDYNDSIIAKNKKALENKAKEAFKKEYETKISREKDNSEKLKYKRDNLRVDKLRAELKKELKENSSKLTKYKSDLKNPKVLAKKINFDKRNGNEKLGLKSIKDYKTELETNKYFKVLDRSKLANSGTQFKNYNAIGKTIKLTDTGQDVFNKRLEKLFDSSDDSNKVLELMDKKPGTLTSDELDHLKSYMNLDEQGLRALQGKRELSSFGQMTDEMSRLTGFAATNLPVKSFESTVNYLRNLNSSAVRQLAEFAGIDMDKVADWPVWFRDTYNKNYLDDAINETSALDINAERAFNPNRDKINTFTGKQLQKTLNTMGLDTDVFMGHRLMLHDSLQGMAEKFKISVDNFNMKNILDAGIKSGDIKMLDSAAETDFFNSAQIQKRRAKGGIVSRYDTEASKLPRFADGSYLVNAESLLNQMNWMKMMLKPGEFEKFESRLIDMAQATGKELPQTRVLRNSYLKIPPQLNKVIKTFADQKKVGHDAQTIFTKTFKTLNRVWKQLALLSASYIPRNYLTNVFNRYLTLGPKRWVESEAQSVKAAKDLARYRGVVEPFSRVRIKKGLTHIIEDEWDRQNNKEFNPANKTYSYKDVISSLVEQNKMSQKDADLANEIMDLENKGIIGGYRIKAEFGGFLNTQNALAGKVAKYSKDKNLLTYSAKKIWTHTVGALTDLNMRTAALFDDASRLGVYRMVDKDKNIAKEFGLESADEVTRHANMDFQNMTDFENNVMRMVIPFYAYFRQSLEQHFKNIVNVSKTGLYRTINNQIVNGQADLANSSLNNDIPEWLRYSGDLPFSFGIGDDNVGMFKLGYSLPYTSMTDVVNFVGDGIRAMAQPSTLNSTRLQQSTGNLASMFSPIIKAAAETATRKKLSTGQAGTGVFLQALGEELGGVFTKIPHIIAKMAAGQDEGQTVSELIGNLVGVYQSIPKDSLARQRVYELIEYLQDEMRKYTQNNVLPSYAYVKQQMEGRHYSKLDVAKPRTLKFSKRKKKLTTIKDSDEFLG